MSDTSTKKFDFMALRKVFAAVSILLVLASAVLLGVRGLNLGLDFTGGTSVELEYSEAPELDDVRSSLSDAGYTDYVVQNFGSDTLVLIRMQEAGDDELGQRILEDIQARADSDVSLISSEFVGSQVTSSRKTVAWACCWRWRWF